MTLFEGQAEAFSMTQRYGFPYLLPGFTAVGHRGWDVLIVRDAGGHFFTVPIALEHLEKFDLDINLANLTADEKLRNKIKWYVTPLIFGGVPSNAENVSWLTVELHPNAVRWWNAKYQEIQAQQGVGGQPATTPRVRD